MRKTLDQLQRHYERNLSRGHQTNNRNKPNYLHFFKYEKEHEVKNRMKAILKGMYSLEKEEIDLCQLMKDIENKSRQVSRRVKSIGIARFVPRNESNHLLRSRTRESRPTTISNTMTIEEELS